jgi:FixJ family two-component response regulator
MAFDSIGPEDSLLARKPIGLHDCSTGNDERDSAVSNQQTIYLIDDDDFLRDSLRELLEEEGFHVIDFAAASAFLLRPREIGYGCIVTDIQMPGMSGLELIEEVRLRDKVIPIIAITAHANPAVRKAVKAAEAILLVKPFDLKALIALISEASHDHPY